MSHKFRKPKPISIARRAAAQANGAKSHGPVTPEGKAKSALNAVTHGLTSNNLVLTTESKEKYDALLASYRAEYEPEGQTENDLVEELTAAKWLQRRTLEMITALIDTTMDRMEKEIRDEFEHIDNAARSALAFAKQTDNTPALALLYRYARGHARDYHRALDKLRQIQSERHNPPSGGEKIIMQNEPKPAPTPEVSIISATNHEPPATDHSTPLATELATSHQPLATSSETVHRPLATDHCGHQITR